jgi:hypothetical protein
MAQVVVSSDMFKVGKLLAEVNQTAVKQSVRRSLRRTVTTVAKQATVELRSRKLIKLKARELKSRIRSYADVRGSDIRSMFGKLKISGKEESLARFFPKRKRAGKSKLTGVQLYTVTTTVLGKTTAVERGFIVKKPKGNVILARVAGVKRLPVEKKTGHSVGYLAQESGVVGLLAKTAQERLQIEMKTNLEFYTARALERAKSGK